MGFHAEVYDALERLIEAAVPGVSVLNELSVDEAYAEGFAKFVLILREGINYVPHPEINPATAVQDQMEQWSWLLLVKGGGGRANQAGKGIEVDKMLESIRTALNAQRLTTDCGPLQLQSEDYEGADSNGVVYGQRWSHFRMA